MTDDELGLLILKVQADDVRPKDLRSFLIAVMNDEELRRNLKLAGKISGLTVDVRQKNCMANVLFLISHSTLGPDGTEEKPGMLHAMTPLFSEKFQVGRTSLWAKHFSAGVPIAAASKKGPRPAKPTLQISKHLFMLITALEDFWDVRGLLTV